MYTDDVPIGLFRTHEFDQPFMCGRFERLPGYDVYEPLFDRLSSLWDASESDNDEEASRAHGELFALHEELDNRIRIRLSDEEDEGFQYFKIRGDNYEFRWIPSLRLRLHDSA